MKVAIIGAGNMAKAFAKALNAGNHEVIIGHRSPEKAAALAREVDPLMEAGGIEAALSSTNLVILALPYLASIEVLKRAGNLSGKILVDISNPITADYKELAIGHTTSAAEEIQAAVGGANVVKAFNTIFAQLVSPTDRGDRQPQAFIAGDNEDANTTVHKLAATLGFESVNAGPLKNARFLEPIGEMNIHFGYFLGKGMVFAPAWVPILP